MFPVRLRVDDETPRENAAAPDADPATSAPRRPMRVLIVDDNRDAADSLYELLTVLEFDAHAVYGGEQALAVVDELRPHAALIDLGMPGMDGVETARRIRARDAGARMVLVALTGWGQEEDREQTRAAGFDHHLVKPAGVEQLLEVLRPSPD